MQLREFHRLRAFRRKECSPRIYHFVPRAVYQRIQSDGAEARAMLRVTGVHRRLTPSQL
jgi:hypothetical protein